MTHVATKGAWYSPCVQWSRGGASGRSVGGIIVWAVGWGCGRSFSVCVFVKVVQLGYCNAILLVQELDVNSGQEMEVSWKFWNGP